MERSTGRRTPRQPRSQERFDKIIETASKLFLERGFDGTTTNEIASRADVSIGSLYQYFDNKEAIVEALADRYVDALREVTADVVAANVDDLSTAAAVDALLDPILKFHLSYPEFRTLWLAAETSPELKASLHTMDEELVGRTRELLKARVPGIPRGRAKAVVTVMEMAVKSLLALIGRSDGASFKAQAATEIKRMLTLYIDGVIRDQKG
jgi:AcrR family transcriptional regulator